MRHFICAVARLEPPGERCVSARTDRPGAPSLLAFKQSTRSDFHESDHVQDAEKAALAITNYREAIDRVAQTSLREMIGSSMLAALLSDMSRQAQAEREKQARVILGSAEAAIAGKFVEAAAVYAGHPWALQLRAMNIIYETTKERGATILMPSSMVDSLNPSAATLAFALAGNDPLGNNRAALNVDALVTKGVPAAVGNGATEPARLPDPAV